MSYFDSTGIFMDPLSVIKEKVIANLKGKWGENMRTGVKSVIGNIVDIFGSRTAEMNEIVEASVSAMNPNTAQGVHLAQVIQFNGIKWQGANNGTCPLELTANAAGAEIEAGSVVSDPLNPEQKFSVDDDHTLAPLEVKVVSSTAVNASDEKALAGTLTKIDNPVLGWESVTNLTDSIPGNARESASSVRARREVAASKTGTAGTAAIQTKLADLPSVTHARVNQNNTTQDPNPDGVPRGFVWPIIRGGEDQDIAKALFESVGGGIGIHGSIHVVYEDTEREGELYDMYFDRVTDIPLFIRLGIAKGPAYPDNAEELIKQAFEDYSNGIFKVEGTEVPGFKVGESIDIKRLLTPAQVAQGYKVQLIEIGDSFGTVAPVDFVVGPTGFVTLDQDNIEIYEAP